MSEVELTGLLQAWGQGDLEAREAAWPRLYGELKVIARSVLRSRHTGRSGSAPDTTSLVHDAALRLLDLEVEWNDRHHFYAAAARAMRFLMVDEARRRLARKRGGGVAPVELDEEVVDPKPGRLEEILSVHQALARLARVNPRQERLVELRYFGGFSVEETADVLGVSVPTVVRDWRAVRTWLHGTLQARA